MWYQSIQFLSSDSNRIPLCKCTHSDAVNGSSFAEAKFEKFRSGKPEKRDDMRSQACDWDNDRVDDPDADSLTSMRCTQHSRPRSSDYVCRCTDARAAAEMMPRRGWVPEVAR
jgi:hypothetical protein